MALTVETGTGLPNADSYVHLVDLANYFIAMGLTAEWTALQPVEQEAIARKATAYVDLQTIFPYEGHKQTVTQALQWPRTDAHYWQGGPDIPQSTIPVEVRRAVLEAGRIALTGTLPTQGAAAVAGGREVKKEKVDVLEVEYFHSSQGKEAGAAADAPFGPSAQNKFADPNVLGILLPLLNWESTGQTTGGGVSMAAASQRGGWYAPSNTPPAFSRGMNDAHPLSEERARLKWP